MSVLEIKQTLDELKTTFQQFKDADERHEAEVKKLGDATEETKQTLDRINTKLDEIEKKGEEIAKKMDRTRVLGGAGAVEVKTEHVEYKKNLLGALKHLALGTEMTPDQKKWLYDRSLWSPEMKALTTDNDQQSGYLVLPEMINEIIKGIVEFSPVRELARVRPTTAKSVKQPVRKGVAKAVWTSERATRNETQAPKYGMEEIPTHEFYSLIPVSRQDLDDSAFNLESELNMEMQEQFGVAEGETFILGSGVGEPEGLLTNAEIEAIVSGNASDITADSLIDLFFALKDGYARNATWLLRRSSLKQIRKFKDGQGQYLWQPGIAGTATPATILDRAYREALDMPEVAANATPILFGDFRRGYLIVDRQQITMQKLIELYALQGQIGFMAYKRVGGQVILPEAIKKLKVSV
jgi:HK97 family phage major capsid protein